MNQPCMTKQWPLILFSVYSISVKTATLRRIRYASFASLYIMLASLLFIQVFFPQSEDTSFCFAISVVCLIFIVSMTSIICHQELVVWMSLHRVLSLS